MQEIRSVKAKICSISKNDWRNINLYAYKKLEISEKTCWKRELTFNMLEIRIILEENHVGNKN